MYMRSRLVAAVFAYCLVATAQTMTVAQLTQFIRSSKDFIAKKQMSDKQVAEYLSKARLSERLDDRTLEDLEGYGIGPKTDAALRGLRDRTQNLATAAPVVVLKPRPIPPPTSEQQAAVLQDVRDYSLNYSSRLPDFICTQVTRRYAAPRPGTYGTDAGSDPSWYKQDELTIRLSYFDQKEQYKLILVNNTPTTMDYEKIGGAKSFGDFGSMLREIFEPATQAHFEWDHWGTLRGRRVMAFAYQVALSNSKYQLAVDDGKLHITVAYGGLVEVDPKTHEVMRVKVNAENIPADFPMRTAGTTLDYDYTDLSGHKFLLPLKAEVLMSDGSVLTRNDLEFRLYRKYTAESEVSFDTPPPLPEDQTKELNCKDPKNAQDPACTTK